MSRFSFNCDNPRRRLTLTPPQLAKMTVLGGVSLGHPSQLNALMISCLTWDRLSVLKWCEGPRSTYFPFYVSDGGMTCWSSCHLYLLRECKGKMWCKIERGISCQHVFIRGVENQNRRWETAREQQPAAIQDKPHSLLMCSADESLSFLSYPF